MPRFHFHIIDGRALVDDHGAELADVEAAKAEAVKLISGVLTDDLPVSVWDGHPWQVVVNDSPRPEAGRTYFTMSLSATVLATQ